MDVATSKSVLLWAASQVNFTGYNYNKNLLFEPSILHVRKYPSLMFVTGSEEILLDDTRIMACKIANTTHSKNLDKDISDKYLSVNIYEHMQHCFPLYWNYFTEADEALDDVTSWIRGL